MTSQYQNQSPVSAVETPWYDLIGDPEPPEDGMQQEPVILDIMSILTARYRHDPTVLCVSALVDVIYDSHIPGSMVAPDGFIVFGVEDARLIKRVRNSYRIDEWGPPPAFVLEVASPSTARRDMNEKRDIYAAMGAQEYWRLDLGAEYYGEHLVGEQLVDGHYQRFELHVDPSGDLWSRSQVLGVDFIYSPIQEGGRFLLRDASTGESLYTLWEEQQLRQEAEAQVEELRQEIERLRQGPNHGQ